MASKQQERVMSMGQSKEEGDAVTTARMEWIAVWDQVREWMSGLNTANDSKQ
jgi:hypothetical protein